MKLKKWLLGAMAFSLLTACSDNGLSEDSNKNPGNDMPDRELSGYLAFEIKLPQETSSTRSENDNFDDGTPEEYAVENAMIVLFRGATEKEAVFHRAQVLTKPFFNSTPENDPISSSYLAAIQVSELRDKDEKYWALVILNYNDKTTKIVTDENGHVTATIAGITMKEATYKEDGELISEATKFQEILDATTEESFRGEDGSSRFFMTNSPLANKPGGQLNPLSEDKPLEIQYMTNLGNTIYDTQEEAKANPSGCVYVERAVAKITYQNGKFDNSKIDLQFVDANGASVKLSEIKDLPYELEDGTIVKLNDLKLEADVKYALTNKNKVSYVIRNVDFDENSHFAWNLTSDKAADKLYRMVGSVKVPGLKSPFHNEQKSLYRTYWCQDPNYGTEMQGNAIQIADDSSFEALSKTLYCKENTFDVKNQNYGNTTLALFRVDLNISGQYGEGENVNKVSLTHFFTKDGKDDVVYLTKESALSDEITRVIQTLDIQHALIASMKPGHANITTEDGFSFNDYIDFDLGRQVEYNEKGEPIKTLQNLVINGIKFKTPKNLADNKWFDEKSAAVFQSIIGGPNGTEEYPKYNENRQLVNAEGKVVQTEEEALKVANHIQCDLLAAVNLLNEVTEYTNGVSYYAIPIKHFGDYYTPWEGEGTKTWVVYNDNSTNWTKDDGHAQRYLGRYGLVRNNWYELNISKIQKLGTASIPEIDGSLSDDNNEVKKYFAVEIHTLSWAKRTQSVDF